MEDDKDKKDKKLVFLSRSVLQKVRERPMVTGTQIANEILEMYKQFCDVSPFAPMRFDVGALRYLIPIIVLW